MTEHDVCEILKIGVPESSYLTKLLVIANAFYKASEHDMEHGRPAMAALSRKAAESILDDLKERGVINRD